MNSTKQGRKGTKQGRNRTYDVWSEINHRISEFGIHAITC